MKKPNKIQQEYRNELRKYKDRIRKAKQRGYVFEDLIEIKDTPSKADVKKIKELKGKKLYEKALYVGLDTGELLQGKTPRGYRSQYEAWKEENEYIKLPQKPISVADTEPIDFYQTVVDNFIDEIEYYYTTYTSSDSGENAKQNIEKLLNTIKNCVASQGIKATAEALRLADENGYTFTRELAYKDDEINNFIRHILQYIPNTEDIVNQLDNIDEYESYSAVQ